jgi:ribosomal protein S18 acetylase RimI-like enzyme
MTRPRAEIVIVDYSPRYESELVRMWRDSFERAINIRDPHPIEQQVGALNEQIVPQHRVLVALEKNISAVIGFIAYSSTSISHLYVHVDYQHQGIGSTLLNIAKENCDGSLRLFTFQANVRAQQFYERHGFRVIGRGFEEKWQLKDVEYEWTRPK